ncbi:MAG: DUF3332 family protein [Candidatus Rokubacteria bacterium]|nr:DUF3332 family protein [Candidatus Rokubacteria bacterium]
MRFRATLKGITLVTLLLFVLAVSGCYGGFHLTKALYKFNGEVKVDGSPQANRVAQSVVMVLLVIIPVYQLAALADAVILNSIEFWTGKNPMTADDEPAVRTVYKGTERYVQTFVRTASAKEMQIEYFKEGRQVNTVTIRQESDSPVVTADVRWSDGRHERYQLRHADGETYLIGHTSAMGGYRQGIADRDQVADISNRVQVLLASPVPTARAFPTGRFQ